LKVCADWLFEEGKGGEVFVIRIRARQAVVNQAGVFQTFSI